MAKKVSKKQSKKLNKTARRLAAYSAAAAATVVTAGDQSANAAEIVHDIADVTVEYASLDINMVSGNATPQTSYYFFYYGRYNSAATNGVYSFNMAHFYTYFNPYFYGNGTSLYAPGDPLMAVVQNGGGKVAAQLGHSAAVGGALTSPLVWAADGNSDWAVANKPEWDDEEAGERGHGFIGLSFSISGEKHYGWLEVTRVLEDWGDFNDNGDVEGNDFLLWQQDNGIGEYQDWEVTFGNLDVDGSGVIVHGFGYQTDPGVASLTPTVGGSTVDPAPAVAAAGIPEPSSILLLALGAAGMGSWRRRRSND